MQKSVVSSAYKKYYKNDYKGALELYLKASELFGIDNFKANVILCHKRLNLINDVECVNSNSNSYKLISKEINIDEDIRIYKTRYWKAIEMLDSISAEKYLKLIKELSKPKNINNKWIEIAENRIKKIVKEKKYEIKIKFEEIVNLIKENKKSRIYEATKNKIAYFLHNSLPYSSGGYATRAHGMAIGLKGNGLNVICVSRPGFPLDIQSDHSGKECAFLDLIDGIEYHRIFEPKRNQTETNIYIIEAAKEIKKFLINQKIDMVMAASNHLTAIPAGIAARQLGLPFFYEVRGFWEITRVSREPEYIKTKQFAGQVYAEVVAANYADRVFTLTTPMVEELVRRGIPENKITLLPNSCDPSRFSPRSRDIELAEKLGIPKKIPVIGYIGSFVQYEGLDDLAKASVLLLKRGIDFRLLLVGNENASGSEKGPITEEILRVADEHGLKSKLIMPGRVPHEQVESYYSLIDIAPFPRKPQPVTEMVSPMKPLEALAMQKAVIVSSVRALEEMIVNNTTGLIFKKGDIEDLANKLETLIKNSDLRDFLGKNGRRWVQNERIWLKTASIAVNKFLES